MCCLRSFIMVFLLSNVFVIACATSQIALTTGDLLDQSDSVVVATCSEVVFRTGEPNLLGRAAYFEFEINEFIKGSPSQNNGKLNLRLGGISEVNTPFKSGERVILFLGQTNNDGYPTLYGSEQAVLRVEPLHSNFPHPALSSNGLIKNKVTGLNGSGGAPYNNKPMTLDYFIKVARERVIKNKGMTP